MALNVKTGVADRIVHEHRSHRFRSAFGSVPSYEFHKCVTRYRGRSPAKLFLLAQFLAMAFAQLTYRESLRDIGRVFMTSKLYHNCAATCQRSTLRCQLARLAHLRGLAQV